MLRRKRDRGTRSKTVFQRSVALSVYHCLVLVRPEGVPQLRSLSCEADDTVAEAVKQVVGEWQVVSSVEVFRDGILVMTLDRAALSAL